jgi:2-aminoadipate transaminase
MQLHYKNQCKAILNALQSNVPTSYMDYNKPTGGMFLWATIKHQSFRNVSSHDLFVELAGKGIIAVPGDEFYVPPLTTEKGTGAVVRKEFPCLRLSFAAPSVSTINEGAARLAAALDR